MTPEQVDKLIDIGQMALEQGWYDQAREYFKEDEWSNLHAKSKSSQ